MGIKYGFFTLTLIVLMSANSSHACMLHEIWQSRGGEIKLTLDIVSLQTAGLDIQLSGYAIARQMPMQNGRQAYHLMGRDEQPLLTKADATGMNQVISGRIALDLAMYIHIDNKIIKLSGLHLTIHNGDRPVVRFIDEQGAVWLTTHSLSLRAAATHEPVRFQPMTVYPGGMLMHRYPGLVGAEVVVGELDMVFPPPANLQTLYSVADAEQPL